MNIQSLHIGKRGIEKALGSLEAAVMEVLWKSNDPQSARDVTSAISKKKDVSFNAISTVLNRLEEKDMVKRHAEGKRYKFSAVESKKTYSRRIFFSGIQALFQDSDLLTAAGLSGNTGKKNVDAKTLKKLEELLDSYDEQDT